MNIINLTIMNNYRGLVLVRYKTLGFHPEDTYDSFSFHDFHLRGILFRIRADFSCILSGLYLY